MERLMLILLDFLIDSMGLDVDMIVSAAAYGYMKCSSGRFWKLELCAECLHKFNDRERCEFVVIVEKAYDANDVSKLPHDTTKLEA